MANGTIDLECGSTTTFVTNPVNGTTITINGVNACAADSWLVRGGRRERSDCSEIERVEHRDETAWLRRQDSNLCISNQIGRCRSSPETFFGNEVRHDNLQSRCACSTSPAPSGESSRILILRCRGFDPSRPLALHSCRDAKSALPTASIGRALGLRTKPMRRREFISRERIEAEIARPFTAAVRCLSLCARPGVG
jgi:hypothetical protein